MHRAAPLLLLLALIPIGAKAETLEQVQPRAPEQRVVDQAGLLSKDERQKVLSRLIALEKTGLAQGAVMILSSIEGDTIEKFANKLARKWKIGHKDKHNGFLILLAVGQRRVRLETANGIREVIPDAAAQSVITDTMTPQFRKKRYAQGLIAAIVAIGAKLRRGATKASTSAK